MGGAVAGVQCWQCWPPDKWVLRRWMQQAGRQAIDTKHQPSHNRPHRHQAPTIYLFSQQSTTRVVSEVRLGPANVPAAEPPKFLKVHLKSASLSDAFHLIENCVWIISTISSPLWQYSPVWSLSHRCSDNLRSNSDS